MDINTLTRFFMWCTIINGTTLIAWTILFAKAPDFVYRMQGKLVSMPKETFSVVVYSAIALLRVLFLIFNVTPYIALLIIG